MCNPKKCRNPAWMLWGMPPMFETNKYAQKPILSFVDFGQVNHLTCVGLICNGNSCLMLEV